MDSELIIVLIAFPIMFLFVSFIATRMGWSDVAELYRCDQKPEGRYHRYRSGGFGLSSYSNCLTIGICEQGFYLSLTLPFMFFHPPLLIPWDQFHSTRKKNFLLFHRTQTYIGIPTIAQLNLPAFVYDELIERETQIEIIKE